MTIDVDSLSHKLMAMGVCGLFALPLAWSRHWVWLELLVMAALTISAWWFCWQRGRGQVYPSLAGLIWLAVLISGHPFSVPLGYLAAAISLGCVYWFRIQR